MGSEFCSGSAGIANEAHSSCRAWLQKGFDENESVPAMK